MRDNREKERKEIRKEKIRKEGGREGGREREANNCRAGFIGKCFSNFGNSPDKSIEFPPRIQFEQKFVSVE